MRQEFDDNARRSLVEYRLHRAKDTLREADILISQLCFNAAVNRLYYACYYAVIALLVSNNIPAQTHQGVKQMFGLNFVVKRKIAGKYGHFIANCSTAG